MGCSQSSSAITPAAGAPPKGQAQHIEWRPTPEQAAANAKAAAHIAEHAAKMEQATEEDKKPAMTASGKYVAWDLFSGATIESALEHTPLIDLEYLVTLGRSGGVLPRGRQNVPPAAFITKANLWRLKLWNKKRPKYALGVLIWSYPWLDAHHSDKLGAQLRQTHRTVRRSAQHALKQPVVVLRLGEALPRGGDLLRIHAVRRLIRCDDLRCSCPLGGECASTPVLRHRYESNFVSFKRTDADVGWGMQPDPLGPAEGKRVGAQLPK